MLQVSNLAAAYGRIPILDGVSFTVAEGEFVGILGHNGMGKTTLLKTLMGYLKATRGEVAFDGADITHARPHERARMGIGYVPQGREIFPGLSVRDNLRLGPAGQGREDKAAMDEILTEFPRLLPLLDRQGGALSGGEQQILALARALICAPRLLLLDEPTEGIQPSVIEEIEALLRQMKSKRRLTVILVEQNLDFIKTLSERVLIIQKGRILREVAADALGERALIGEFVGIEATEGTRT